MSSVITEGLRLLFSRRGILAIAGAGLVAGTIAWSGPTIAAQKKQEPKQPDAPAQIALTPQHIQNFIAGYKAVEPLLEKLSKLTKEDPKLESEFDAAAKKHGFASGDEFETVYNSIFAVWDGIDPKTKQYSDPVAQAKKDLAEVQADKTLKPADRKKYTQEINERLKQLQPVQHQGNIQLIVKYYDELAKILPAGDQQEEEPPPPPQKKGKK